MRIRPAGPPHPGIVEPAAPAARDWVLAGLVAASSVAEVLLREDLTWHPMSLALGLLLAWTMLWRRTHPLAMVVVAFVASTSVDVASLALAGVPISLYSGGFILILVYCLLRWAGTVHATIGSGVVVAGWLVSVVTDTTSIEEVVGGALVLLLASILGLTMRYRALILAQRFEQVRSQERESLARELHDTVAHHVSAIAVQAQAGRILLSTHDVDGASNALLIIEEEASTTLTEMRSMVGALRRGVDNPHLVHATDLIDIDALATPTGVSAGPVIEVEHLGDLKNLSAPVVAMLYRVAQESITNARRHARYPTLVRVLLEGLPHTVCLTVTDDGEQRAVSPRMSRGYGLVGMAERSALLGGSLTAGPLPEGGWQVKTTIPRSGGRS